MICAEVFPGVGPPGPSLYPGGFTGTNFPLPSAAGRRSFAVVESSSPVVDPAGVTVGEFFRLHGEALGLKLAGRETGFERKIREPTINRPGLALAGFHKYFAWKRIQVFGSAELAYLRSLPEEEMRARFHALCRLHIPCAVFSRSAVIPPALLDEAKSARLAVFRTPMVTKFFVNAATIILEADFAPSTLEHGCMVDILGVGVLLRGASGIGKSETVLGLIERSHSLVSDDVTRLRAYEHRELIGTSPPTTRNHMEIRGVGILNILEIFGAGAIREEKRLDMVVTLKDWQECDDVDRIGLDQDTYTLLGISVPHLTIPVRPGRDLARLVEVAALDQKLKRLGHDAAKEFNQRLLDRMNKPAAPATDASRFFRLHVSAEPPFRCRRLPRQQAFARIHHRQPPGPSRPALRALREGHVALQVRDFRGKGRRAGQRQEHHGPHDAGRGQRLRHPRHGRGARRRAGAGRAGRADRETL